MNKRRVRIPYLNKVRSELQREIGSKCPFCENEDVGHFEIHHIDENPEHNENINLLLLCPTCHSKITKGDIALENVLKAKTRLLNFNARVQFLSVNVDSENCGWVPIDDTPNAFEARKLKSLFPIFNFSFINHSAKTVVLTNIQLTTKKLPIGLSGPMIPLPQILRPVVKYKIQMPPHGKTINTSLDDEIEVPQSRAFKFQIELFTATMESFNPQFNKYALQFSFGFNNDFYIDCPKILLNTKTDYDQLQHVMLC